MRRSFVAALTIVVLGAGSWVVATRTESPDQAAARTEAPAPTPVVARLEMGRLQPAISLTATTQRERKFPIVRLSAQSEVVTSINRSAGEEIRPADVLLRANGRPVFVLPGAFPMYRDLVGGDTGDDVAQLQVGLRAGGYATGRDQLGTFGSGTKAALTQMYNAARFPPPDNDAEIRSEMGAIDAQISAGATDPTLRRNRDSLVGRLGPRALMTELATVSELPAVVETIVAVGSPLAAGEPLATVGAGNVILTAAIPTSSAAVVIEGAMGSFTDQTAAERAVAVRSVGAGASADESIVTMTSADPIDAGMQVVVRIDNPGAETADRLLAPIASVVMRGGRSYLYRLVGDHFEETEIVVIGSAGGVAAIEPVDPAADLPAGTEVRVGVR